MVFEFICTTLFRFLLILLPYSCYSQTKNDLTKRNLRGRVKLLKEREYQGKYDIGNIVADKLYFINSYEFSFNGNLTQDTSYGGIEPLYRDTFYYKDGNLHAKKENHFGNYSYEYTWSYRYDTTDHIVEEKFVDISNVKVNWKVLNSYDRHGNKIEEYRYNSEGKLTSRSMYLYDGSMNLVELRMYDNKDSLILSESMKYDTNNNKIEDVGYFEGGLKKYTYKYDCRGNQVEECYYYADSLVSKKNFVYSDFDHMDNWRKKIVFIFEKLGNIYFREIVYY